MIDKKKIEYYNSVSRQYVEMLTVCDYGDFDDVVYDKDGTTAIPGVNIIDMVSTQNDDNGDYISVEYIKNGILYSLSEDNCSIINRCVTDVYKSIKKSVTYATVQKEVYNWIVFSKIGEMDILLGDQDAGTGSCTELGCGTSHAAEPNAYNSTEIENVIRIYGRKEY